MTMRPPRIALTSLACLFAGSAPTLATTLNYPGFSNTAGLTIVGNAATAGTGDGTVLRVIPATGGQAGAAYSTTPITLGTGDTFSTQFSFRFTQPGGIDPADGITFVLVASPGGLGTPGYGMGYQGVANSIAIELDTYNNGVPGVSYGYFPAEPNSSNHVAIDLNGQLTNTDATNVYGVSSCGFAGGIPSQSSYLAKGCMANGDLWTTTITYDGTNLNVSLTDPAEGYTFNALSNVGLNIASYLGGNTAYVGFTGSSGSGWENEDITSWQFANTATLPGGGGGGTTVPEPASLLLLAGGLAGAGVARRRVLSAAGGGPC